MHAYHLNFRAKPFSLLFLRLSVTQIQCLTQCVPMAKSEIISKKRKRPLFGANDGHSLTGILTRSKSQINLQCYRSGESRTDSTWGRIQQRMKPLSGRRKGSSPAEDSSMGCDLSSGSIKDLRLRRVFSPFSEDGVIRKCLNNMEKLEKSEPGGDCLGGSNEAHKNGDFQKLDMSNADTLLSTPPDSEIFGSRQVVEENGNEFLDQVLENKTKQNLLKHDGIKQKGFHEDRNGSNSSTKSILKPRSRVKLFKTPSSFSYRRLLPYLMDMEKERSSTPIVSNCQKTERGLKEEQLSDSRCEEKMDDDSKTNGSMEGNNNDFCNRLNMVSVESLTTGDLESSMPFVNGTIQTPGLQVSCEGQNLNRSKLNSSPTIVDSCFYKEKLTDVICNDQMTKYDDEVAETNGPSHCSAQSQELLDQKLLTVINNSESCDSDNIRKNSDDEQKQSEIKGMPIATTFVTSGKEMCMETSSSKSFTVEHYNNDESLSSVGTTTPTRCPSHKQVGDSPMLMDSQQEQESLVVHAALDTIQKLENSPGSSVEPSAMSSSSLTSSKLLPGEKEAKLVSHPPEEVCIKSTLKCADSEKETEAYNPPGVPVAVVKKGILKRNPRGCRGVCTCLNCSSFRLRAERSFEFSRNQMQDAEEVALDLIKELSWLRNLLEKSAFDAKDQSSIRINQVKETCKKASVAEEVARTRIREMKYDLNIHCRIPCGQQPSVRFANNVEEHVFTISHSSTK